MNSHRQRARRRTVTWQAASLALLAGGIAVGALPIAGLLGPGKAPKPKDFEVAAPAGGSQSMSQTRQMRLKDALATIAPPVEVTAVAVEVPVEGAEDPEPPPVEVVAPASTSWAYVGNIRAGGRMKLAIINVMTGGENKQRTLSEGELVDDTKLVTIERDHIMVSVGGAEPTRIELSERVESAAWAARSSTGMARGAAGRPMPGQPGFGNPGNNPGMNPNAAANLAEAQRRMKAAISPPHHPMASMVPPPAEDRMMQLTRQAKEMGELGQDKRDSLSKILDDPSLSPEERGKLLSEIGIPMDATPDERGEYLHMIGVTPDNDPKLYERLREGTGGHQ